MHMPCKDCICEDVCKRNNQGDGIEARVDGCITKKERNLVKILPPQGYAQQEVHPCLLDNKTRFAVAHLPQLRVLNMVHREAFYA
jgi:hypothetical protein